MSRADHVARALDRDREHGCLCVCVCVCMCVRVCVCECCNSMYLSRRTVAQPVDGLIQEGDQVFIFVQRNTPGMSQFKGSKIVRYAISVKTLVDYTRKTRMKLGISCNKAQGSIVSAVAKTGLFPGFSKAKTEPTQRKFPKDSPIHFVDLSSNNYKEASWTTPDGPQIVSAAVEKLYSKAKPKKQSNNHRKKNKLK